MRADTPPITVETSSAGDTTVTMHATDERTVTAYLIGTDKIVLSTSGAPCVTLTDMRRFTDAVAAAHAGMWQPNPTNPWET